MKNRIRYLKTQDGIPFSVSVRALAEFDKNRKVVFINGITEEISRIIMQNGSQK
jgi:hypothetical protein